MNSLDSNISSQLIVNFKLLQAQKIKVNMGFYIKLYNFNYKIISNDSLN